MMIKFLNYFYVLKKYKINFKNINVNKNNYNIQQIIIKNKLKMKKKTYKLNNNYIMIKMTKIIKKIYF